jgi:hypothetical protein
MKIKDSSANNVGRSQGLTYPGDFAVVKEQYTFINQSKVTHQQLIE